MPTPRRNETREDFLNRAVSEVMDEGAARSREQAAVICSSIWEQRDNPRVRYMDRYITERNQSRGGSQERLGSDLRSFLRKEMVLTPAELVGGLQAAFPNACVVSIGGDEYWNMEVHVGLDEVTPVATIRVECDYSNVRPQPLGYLVWDRYGTITNFEELVDRLRCLGATT